MMKKAFSLIELSIVILIIGILVAGVTQSSRLIKEFRLKTAQSLTRNSPISSIKNLVLWYETSLDGSLLESEKEEGLNVTTWYDINPQSTNKINAIQSTLTNQPTFRENIFNNAIPAIRFDGSDNFMTFDGSLLINSNYTIFVVEQRRDGGADSYFIGGTTESANSNLILGYRDTDTITQAHYANDSNYDLAAFSNPIARIHTFRFSTNNGKSYWLNGGVTADDSEVTQTAAITSFSGSSIARYTLGYYNGDIAEIIIFNSALKTEERQSIEEYLSKKYNITIS